MKYYLGLEYEGDLPEQWISFPSYGANRAHPEITAEFDQMNTLDRGIVRGKVATHK